MMLGGIKMNNGKAYRFLLDPRLGIKIPHFDKEWEEYTEEEQLDAIGQWEHERAKIPDRIKTLEMKIIEKQEAMFEMSFEEYCEVHKDVIDLASSINDLNIWYRTEGYVTNNNN